MNLYLFHMLKLNGNHNPFQLSKNLEKAGTLSEKIRIATQVSPEDEIEQQFQKEIVRSEYVSVLVIIGSYLCQEIPKNTTCSNSEIRVFIYFTLARPNPEPFLKGIDSVIQLPLRMKFKFFSFFLSISFEKGSG